MRKWILSAPIPDGQNSVLDMGEAVENDDGTLRVTLFCMPLHSTGFVGRAEPEIDLTQFMSEIRRAHAVKTLKERRDALAGAPSADDKVSQHAAN